MEHRTRQIFHTLWLGAIMLCIAAAVFVLFFTSCTRGGEDPKTDDVVIATPNTAVAVTATTEPMATPTPTPEVTETPVPEPAG
ncbi:MAG: hypothetical protein ACI3W7_02595 [Oscillospiraceae bacterium]